jgi:DegV family protein with EDD domain
MTTDVAIITDSSAIIPPGNSVSARIVPLHLNIGDESFVDGTLSPDQLFAHLGRTRAPVRTAAPAPGEFLKAFLGAHATGAASALCLTLSSRYSGTHAVALTAAGLARERIPGFQVAVVDTGTIAAAHGMAVLAAAEAVAEGATVECAAGIARRNGRESMVVGAVETTRYLARSGRVPRVLAQTAELLGIKPVFSFRAGRARLVGRSRRMDEAVRRIVTYAARHARPGGTAVVMHTRAPALAEHLEDSVRDQLAPTRLSAVEFTSVMAAHTGPGFVALAVHPCG